MIDQKCNLELYKDDRNLQELDNLMISQNSSNPVQDSKQKLNSSFSKFWSVICSLRIEPVMMLFMFSFILNTTCLTNLMMDKGCRFYYNYSEDVCNDIHNDSNIEASNNVEILANNFNLYLNFMAPIGAAIVIFLAPWSDKYGRKPLLISALLGFFMNDIGIILCTVYFNSPIGYIILANLPTQLSGGFICVMTIIYSHISEVSDIATRSLKYTFLQIAFGLAVTFGALAGGQLYKSFSYFGVFITMAVGHFLAVVWVVFMIPETRGLDTQVSMKKKLRDLFAAQNFTEGIKTCWKIRENRGRFKLWLLLLSSCTFALTYEVYTDIAYVYTHHMYKWDPITYSQMWAIFSFSEMIVVFVCTFLFIKVFKFSDPLIGIIGSISIMGKTVFLAFAFELWLYYVSNIFGNLNGLGNLAVRSLISKLVTEDEMGKVFAFLATCEAIVPLLGSIVIAKIFNATIQYFPGSCYLAATCFLVLPLGTFGYQFKQRVRKNHPEMLSSSQLKNF